MRLYEVWHPRMDVRKIYDDPYSADTNSTSPSSTSTSTSTKPKPRMKGVRFACAGWCILPPAVEGWPPFITALALLVGSIVYIIMAILVNTNISIIFTIIGGISFLFTWYYLLTFLITDPGFLPKHITAIPQLVPERLSCPSDAIGPPPPVTKLNIQTKHSQSSNTFIPFDSKFCVTCRIWRPLNTHHCSTCGGCISDFDHHCGILGKCVGSGNIHTFFYLLWSAMISCLYGFVYCLLIIIFNSINYNYPNNDINGNTLPDAYIYDNTQSALWITGGVCLGLIVFGNGICSCLRTCMQSFCGIAFISLIGLIGYLCILIAYIRGAQENYYRLEVYNNYYNVPNNDHNYKQAIIPAIIAIFPYLYVSLIVGGMAIGSTTMWSVEKSTKVTLQTATSSSSSADATTATVTRHTEWNCRSRLYNLYSLLCIRSLSYHTVNFRTDVTELKKLIKQAEIEVFNRAEQRVLAQQQQQQFNVQTTSSSSSTSSIPNISTEENPLPIVLRPVCQQALEFSLSPGMLEDALEIIKTTEEGIEKKPQKLQGILLGKEFLPLSSMHHIENPSMEISVQ